MISWSQPLSDSEAEESVGVEVSMLPKDEDCKPVAKALRQSRAEQTEMRWRERRRPAHLRLLQ